MRKGIGVSPGVVVGVAHRVESVLGSIEQETLDDPGLVAAEIDAFDRAVAASAAELEVIVQKVAEELGASEADIFKSHLQIVNDPGAAVQGSCADRKSAVDRAVGLASRHERVRVATRADPARAISRSDDRHPRRDPPGSNRT